MSDEERNKLEYRDWRDDGDLRRRFAAQAIGGFFLAAGVVFACGFVWGISNVRWNPNYTQPFQWKGPSVCTAIGFGSLFALAMYARRRGSSGFVAGLVIGFCGMLILQGICFSR